MPAGSPQNGGQSAPRLLTKLAFVVSAALAALALRLAWESPLAGIVLLGVIASLVGLRWASRRRTRRILRSGDVETILERWSSSLDRIPHPETMRPLMTATALAAHGWVDQARAVLRTAERGPAWDAALEHRLFLESLLLTFEGSFEQAERKAAALAALPLPSAEPSMLERITMLRGAVAALIRAFSRKSLPGDAGLMLEASDASPLVHWAMRYGAAIEAVDAGELGRARGLIAEAPSWPSQSYFASFHHEIDAELERRASADLD
ncbi:MAG TPA: hypothetical protein ENK57_04670 [Polyangiaceae bacterium]|nr:hypothetical protein [Polyangiaceae bacterium]